MQLVGQTAHSAFQGVKLLIQIGAKAFQLGRVCQIFGSDFLVEISSIDCIIRISSRMGGRWWWLQRGFPLRQFRLVALFHIGAVFHRDLCLALILLLVLTAFGCSFGVFFLGLVLSLRLRAVVVLLRLIVRLIVIGRIRVIAQLVTIAEVRDDLARKAGKGRLIRKHMVDIVQSVASLFFDKAAPQVHHIGGRRRKIAARRQMTHHIPCRHRQRRVLRAGDLAIALPVGLMPDLGVDIAGGSGHVPRAHGFAARCFHRVIDVARKLARGRIAGRHAFIMELAAQGKGISRAACQKYLIAGHATADLRQPHAIAVHAGRVHRIGDSHLRVIGHDFCCLGQGFLERIGGIVGRFGHVTESSGLWVCPLKGGCLPPTLPEGKLPPEDICEQMKPGERTNFICSQISSGG